MKKPEDYVEEVIKGTVEHAIQDKNTIYVETAVELVRKAQQDTSIETWRMANCSDDDVKTNIKKLMSNHGLKKMLEQTIELLNEISDGETYMKRLVWDLEDTLRHYESRYDED